MTLDQIDPGVQVIVRNIDWDRIPGPDGHRLRLLGLEEGASVELLHRGMLFWRDPIGVRIGRMTIAMRSAHASAVHVSEEPADGVAEAPEQQIERDIVARQSSVA